MYGFQEVNGVQVPRSRCRRTRHIGRIIHHYMNEMPPIFEKKNESSQSWRQRPWHCTNEKDFVTCVSHMNAAIQKETTNTSIYCYSITFQRYSPCQN